MNLKIQNYRVAALGTILAATVLPWTVAPLGAAEEDQPENKLQRSVVTFQLSYQQLSSADKRTFEFEILKNTLSMDLRTEMLYYALLRGTIQGISVQQCLGEMEKADNYSKALAAVRGGQEAMDHYQKAKTNLVADLHANAIAPLDKACAIQGFYQPYLWRGYCHLMVSNYVAAARDLETAIATGAEWSLQCHAWHCSAVSHQGFYDQAVADAQAVIRLRRESSLEDYANLAWYQLLDRQYSQALKSLEPRNPLSDASASVGVKMNYAHALLLNDRLEEAKKVYLDRDNLSQPVGNDFWATVVLDDFQALRRAHVNHPDFARIGYLLSRKDIPRIVQPWVGEVKELAGSESAVCRYSLKDLREDGLYVRGTALTEGNNDQASVSTPFKAMVCGSLFLLLEDSPSEKKNEGYFKASHKYLALDFKNGGLSGKWYAIGTEGRGEVSLKPMPKQEAEGD